MLFKKRNNKVNIIRLSGVISEGNKKGISFEISRKIIDQAFEKKAKAVAVIINSPGGSPVQSEMVANYIRRKSDETGVKVITFVEEVAASGGYWLALAGDSVYAMSKSSIVGSLGVLYASFGLEDFIKKHDIKRRVHTAGKNKVSLDIFQEEKVEDVVRLKNMLAEVHVHFKDWVLSRRKNKITLNEEDLFSGEFWLASVAIKYGLIDDIVVGLEDKLKDLYGDKVKFNYIKPKKPIFGGIPFLKSSSDNIVDSIVARIKEEGLWSKFGL